MMRARCSRVRIISWTLAVRSAVNAIRQSGIIAGGRQLSFLVDPATKRLVARVIDMETREVGSQIPTDRVLQIAATISGTKRGRSSLRLIPWNRRILTGILSPP